jgi:integrase
MTLAGAHDAVKAAKDALDHGQDPSAPRKATGDQGDTLAHWVEEYRKDRVAGMRGRVAAYYNADLDRFLAANSGKLLKDVSKADVKAAIDAAKKRGDCAAVQCWKTIRGALAWIENNGPDDFTAPGAKLTCPAKVKDRDRVLDDAELKKVWKAADAAGSFGRLVKMLILTGCRRNEIAELFRDELGDDAIELPGERTKNGVAHKVPLTAAMRQVLKACPKTGKFVINGLDRPLTGFSKPKKALNDGVKDWRLHDLRRTMATGMGKLGILPRVIEACLNHVVGGVVGTYQRHKYETEKADAFKAWSDHVAALVAEKMKAAA